MKLFSCFFFILFFLLSAMGIAQQNRIHKKNFSKYRISKKIKINHGDTLEIDTIVIKYKRKDTGFAVRKYKGSIPNLYPRLGGYENFNHITPKIMNEILDSPIRVYDAKGQEYKVISFLFGYKQKDEFIDDETMELKTSWDYYSLHILQDSIPFKYKKNIIKKGEHFWFEKIIVENQKGEKFIAPSFKIPIE